MRLCGRAEGAEGLCAEGLERLGLGGLVWVFGEGIVLVFETLFIPVSVFFLTFWVASPVALSSLFAVQATQLNYRHHVAENGPQQRQANKKQTNLERKNGPRHPPHARQDQPLPTWRLLGARNGTQPRRDC